MPAYFITGTGTDIGKTWLSCALLRHWRATGVAARAFKPVMSGVDPLDLAASDAGQLLLAQELPVNAQTVAENSHWRFAAPLSPDMAAAAEGRVIDFADLTAQTCRLASAEFSGITLIEGVGGVMVPLDATHTVLDWIAAVPLAAVVVSGSYLGSMSHTLTALTALRSRGLAVAAVAVNETPGSSVALASTLVSLGRHVGEVPLVGIVRDAPAVGVAALAHILRPSP